jgi:hypothetical protein
METVESYATASWADYDGYLVWRNRRYKYILDQRAQGKTYREIGRHLQVSGTYVSQLEKAAKIKFYECIDTPKYNWPRPYTPTVFELSLLYPLKDFLTEIADGTRSFG